MIRSIVSALMVVSAVVGSASMTRAQTAPISQAATAAAVASGVPLHRCKNRFQSGHFGEECRDKSDTAAAAVVNRTQSENWEEGCYGRWNAVQFT